MKDACANPQQKGFFPTCNVTFTVSIFLILQLCTVKIFQFKTVTATINTHCKRQIKGLHLGGMYKNLVNALFLRHLVKKSEKKMFSIFLMHFAGRAEMILHVTLIRNLGIFSRGTLAPMF